jgi:nucleoside-diphosphate-sugar epimerase
MRIAVAGGAGFIGSARLRHSIGRTGHDVPVQRGIDNAAWWRPPPDSAGSTRRDLSKTSV